MTLSVGSLFAGCGGFDLGFEQAGMHTAWQVEIDAQCREVLAQHWPHTERLEDVRDVGRSNLHPVDLVCGGFPCQDLSIAGRGAGLAGKRSGLWFEFHRIIMELRPRWVVIENVSKPGLLTANGGRDFAIILGGLTGVVPAVPPGGWRSAGIARGRSDLYRVAWRILDSRYFGVPQRRRRVFVIGHLGDGRAAQVLFERGGLRGSAAQGRGAWGPVAGTLGQGAKGTCTGVHASDSYTGQDARQGKLIPTVRALTGKMRMDNQEALGGQLLPAAFDVRNGIETGDVTHTLQAKQGVSLNQAPVISVALRGREDGAAIEAGDDIAFALRAGQGGGDKSITPACTRVHVAFDCQIKGTERTRCVRTGDYAQCQAGRPDAVTVPRGDAVAGTLAASGAGTARPAGRQENETDFLVEHELGVRRLTPVECERLQGFPDGWTSVIWERAQRVDAETLAYLRAHYERAYGVRLSDDQVRRLMSDAARYRMLGNAVTVPVAAWIGRRIVEMEERAA